LHNVLTTCVFQPVYAPSAVAARGGKFRHLPGIPGHVRVSNYCIYAYYLLGFNTPSSAHGS